jgi:MFS family permease
MLAQPIVMAIFSPLAGALSDRIKPYIVASWGMALSCTGLLVFALTLHIAPVWLIMPTLACIGLGFAMFSSPNSNAIMGIVEPRFYGIASSSIATMRVIGQALSMATVTLLMSLFVGNVELRFADPASLVMSSRTAFAVFTVLCAFGTLASFARGRVKSDTSQFSR